MSITKEECEALRAELRELAAVKFMRKHLQEEPKYSLRELLYAFGYILVRHVTSQLMLAWGT